MPQPALVAVTLGPRRVVPDADAVAPAGIGAGDWRAWAAAAFTATPDLLVSNDAKLIAAKDDGGSYWLSSSRAARFTAEIWLRRNGQMDSASFSQCRRRATRLRFAIRSAVPMRMPGG